MDKVAGFLEVDRTSDTHEVIISHPASTPDANGLEHIMLSPRYARHLANLLLEYASYVETETSELEPANRHYRQMNRA
jgi:hypothetical protein